MRRRTTIRWTIEGGAYGLLVGAAYAGVAWLAVYVLDPLARAAN